MKDFPLPDGHNANESERLTEDEIAAIFSRTLKPEHREDPRVLAWILSYIKSRDIRDSAHEVGIHPNTAKALRNRADIFKCIEALTARQVFKFGIDPAGIVEKVKEVVEFDPIDLENEDGSFKKHMRELSGPARRAIKKLKVKNFYETDPNGMKVKAGEILEYEFYDRLQAAGLVGRETDLFKEKKVVEHDVTANMAAVLLESAKRADAIDVTPKPLLEEGKTDE